MAYTTLKALDFSLAFPVTSPHLRRALLLLSSMMIFLRILLNLCSLFGLLMLTLLMLTTYVLVLEQNIPQFRG